MIRTMYKTLNLLIFIVVFAKAANGQNIRYTYDTIVNSNETVHINPTQFRGTLTWQKSTNGLQWTDVNTGTNNYSFTADKIMVVRAKVSESNCTVPWYSDTVLINFVPRINRIEPIENSIGENIRIIGNNFGVYPDLTIMFNNINGEIFFINDTLIDTKIPLEIDTPGISLKVVLYNTFDTVPLELLPPYLFNSSPETLSIGDVVSIKGANFSGYSLYDYITVGKDNAAEIIYAEWDSLRFIMPSGSYSNRNTSIKVCVGGKCDSLENVLYIDDAWLQRGNAPGGQFGRYYATGFQLGDTGYMGMGLGLEFDASADFWKYDYFTDTWKRIADFAGGARTHAISFVLNDTAYVGGGYQNSNMVLATDFWRYNAGSDDWTRVADIPSKHNAGAATFVIDNKAYMFTEESDSNFWIYNPQTNIWTKKDDFNPHDFDPYFSGYCDIGFQMNNKGYILTNDNSTYPDQLWEYDPVMDTLTRKADQLDDLTYRDRIVFVINNEAYLFPDAYSELFAKYNPLSNTWEQLPNAKPGGRNDGVVFVIHSKVYLGTGTYYSDSYRDFWEYDPVLDE
jgi:hypothetical protein